MCAIVPGICKALAKVKVKSAKRRIADVIDGEECVLMIG